MKYIVKGHTFKNYDERVFNLEDENGEIFAVDIFSDGGLGCPEHNTTKEFEDWLFGMVGKTLEIPQILPFIYTTRGKIEIVDADKVCASEDCKEKTRNDGSDFCGFHCDNLPI